MGENHHNPYQNSITEFKASDMNQPLGELDNAITNLSGEVDFHIFGSGESTGSLDDEIRVYDISEVGYRRKTVQEILNAKSHPYDVGIYLSGEIPAGQALIEVPIPRTVNFTIDMGDSQGRAGIACTAESIFSIQKDGVEFAKAIFGSGEALCSFSGEAKVLVTGEVLSVITPDPADATLQGIGFTLVGSRI